MYGGKRNKRDSAKQRQIRLLCSYFCQRPVFSTTSQIKLWESVVRADKGQDYNGNRRGGLCVYNCVYGAQTLSKCTVRCFPDEGWCEDADHIIIARFCWCFRSLQCKFGRCSTCLCLFVSTVNMLLLCVVWRSLWTSISLCNHVLYKDE